MVIILPTSGYNRQNPWQPTQKGWQRIKKGVRILRANPNDLMIPTGGCAINDQLSEAKVYQRCIEENYPDISHQIRGISDRGICTVQDLLNVVDEFVLGPSIGFIGSRYQFRRAELTLKSLGFPTVTFLPSGEKEPRFLSRQWRKELMFYRITRNDPRWQSHRAQSIIRLSQERLDSEIRPFFLDLLASSDPQQPVILT